jgi:anti-sigma B factor antagonist
VTASLRMLDEGGLRIGVVEGDVDLASARDLAAEILNAVPSAAQGLVLDLTHVRYLDSTGVSMLLEIHRSLDSRRQRLSVVLPRTSHLWRLFEITGLPTILRVGESLLDAKEAAVQQ